MTSLRVTPAVTQRDVSRLPKWAQTELAEHRGEPQPGDVFDEIGRTVAELSDWLTPTGSLIADLGCSDEGLLRRIPVRHPDRALTFNVYDDSQPRLNAASRLLVEDGVPGLSAFRFVRRDIVSDGFIHDDAALTTALFTLGFLPTESRPRVVQAARGRASRDGAILVAERVRPTDARWSEYGADLWFDRQGTPVTPPPMRGVVHPDTEEGNHRLLRDAGWVGVTTVFRWHQWALFGGFAS